MGDEQPGRRTTKGGTANDWDNKPRPPQAMMGWMTDNEWGMDDEVGGTDDEYNEWGRTNHNSDEHALPHNCVREHWGLQRQGGGATYFI